MKVLTLIECNGRAQANAHQRQVEKAVAAGQEAAEAVRVCDGRVCDGRDAAGHERQPGDAGP